MTTGTKEWADKNINFAYGCAHNCVYCYARGIAKRFNREFTKDMLINPQAVAKNYRKSQGRIMIPTSHDLTPDILPETLIVLEKLLKAGNKLLITTKPHKAVIEAICDNFKDYRSQILFRFTITARDNELLKIYEPFAPSYGERLASLSYAFFSGYATSVSIEPFLEGPLHLICDIDKYVTDTIWLGPMNKKYCPKDLWLPIWEPHYLADLKESLYYNLSPETSEKIRYKDSFLLAIN